MGKVKIFVEGIADEKFLSDYIDTLKSTKSLSATVDIIATDGWTKINSSTGEGSAYRVQMKENVDKGGVNLVIFDADDNYAERKREIEVWKEKYGLEFEVFLFPNNKDAGALEDLLEQIINPVNQTIFECWKGYEDCLKTKVIQGRTAGLTIPSKKSKIYAYLEALLGKPRSQKDMLGDGRRDFKNTDHWNLGSAALQPLQDFLSTHL